MKFSLKDLMVVVAFCAGVAWCASQVGFDNGMFWFIVGACGLMSALFVRVARRETGRGWAPLVPMGFLFIDFLLAMAIASLALFVDGLLLIIVGIYCAIRPPLPVRTLWQIAGACALAAFVVGVLPGIAELHRLEQLRREFPVISLEHRLQYQHRASRPPEAANSIINVSVSKRLDEFEQRLKGGLVSNYEFELIHSHFYDRFVRAIGFGVGRMRQPYPEYMRRPPLRDIQFDEAPPDGRPDGDWFAFWNDGKSNSLDSLYKASRIDFLDPDSFGGIIEPPLKVAGFIAHALHYPPTASLEDHKAWILDRLELVSLLKFDEPRVYVLDHLPRMDQLSGDDVPTRPLDAFESGALEKLWSAEDVVINHDGNDYRLLGSLRAASQCLDCHSAKRGNLLGAFTYFLRRAAKDEQPASVE